MLTRRTKIYLWIYRVAIYFFGHARAKRWIESSWQYDAIIEDLDACSANTTIQVNYAYSTLSKQTSKSTDSLKEFCRVWATHELKEQN